MDQAIPPHLGSSLITSKDQRTTVEVLGVQNSLRILVCAVLVSNNEALSSLVPTNYALVIVLCFFLYTSNA